jgi:hypothetical protein
MPNEEFHDLYSSPNTIRVIKSRRMNLAGLWHVLWRRGMNVYWVSVAKSEGEGQLILFTFQYIPSRIFYPVLKNIFLI